MDAQHRATWQIIALSVVPCLLILLGIVLRAAAGPFESDPDYAYLLNGLGLLTLHSPGHYDHPGTTVQIIAALVTLPAWLLSLPLYGMSGLVSAVLSHPEFFLRVINIVLIVADAAAAFYMGWRIRGATNLTAALAAQFSVLLSFSVMIGLNRVTPEPLLLASSLALAGYLAPAVLQPEHFRQTRAYAWRLGALLGFALVTKITALPLLIAVFFLEDRRLRLAAAAAGVLTGLLLTLPIVIHYPHLAKWFVRLFIHTEAYGGGQVGVPAASSLWHGIRSLLGQTPEIFVAFGFYVLLFPLWRGPTRRVIAICAAILALGILMVLKTPGARYLMPVIGAIALANAAIMSQLLLKRGTARIGSLFFAALLALGIWRNALATSAWARDAEQTQTDSQKLLAKMSASGCRLIFYYEANAITYNLSFGDQYTPKRFASDLDKLYPDTVFYDVFAHRFQTFVRPLSSKETDALLAAGRCVYLIGSPMERYSDFGIPRTDLPLVARTSHDLAYSLAVYAWRPK
jgi:hypothetical protein